VTQVLSPPSPPLWSPQSYELLSFLHRSPEFRKSIVAPPFQKKRKECCPVPTHTDRKQPLDVRRPVFFPSPFPSMKERSFCVSSSQASLSCLIVGLQSGERFRARDSFYGSATWTLAFPLSSSSGVVVSLVPNAVEALSASVRPSAMDIAWQGIAPLS